MLVNIWCGDLARIVAGELERCAASMQGAQVWDHLQGSPLPDVYFQAAVLAACRLGSLILFALAYSGTTSFCAFFFVHLWHERREDLVQRKGVARPLRLAFVVPETNRGRRRSRRHRRAEIMAALSCLVAAAAGSLGQQAAGFTADRPRLRAALSSRTSQGACLSGKPGPSCFRLRALHPESKIQSHSRACPSLERAFGLCCHLCCKVAQRPGGHMPRRSCAAAMRL